MNRTPLTGHHEALGARMAPFGGFTMPMVYQGIVAEHTAVRTGVGIFDTGHMGVFHIGGGSAVADLENLLSCPVATLAVGQCRYGFLCNPGGGVLDDTILYRMEPDAFMMVVNAGTRQDDAAWVRSHLHPGTSFEDVSQETGKIDVQGPRSPRLMHTLCDTPITHLGYFRCMRTSAGGIPLTVSRTGYTGEVGFEIYCPASATGDLWQRCLELGATPAGLGARDTLRLEMCLPLYGHELSAQRNAAESGLLWAIDPGKTFIGCDAVRDPLRVRQRLCALRLADRRAARAGTVVELPNGASVGCVTSGSYAPSLGVAIALGYIDSPHAVTGNDVQLPTAKVALRAQIIPMPLYRQATGRQKLDTFL